jgi:hypothetical protein
MKLVAVDGHHWLYSKGALFRFCTDHPNELQEHDAKTGTYKPARIKTK